LNGNSRPGHFLINKEFAKSLREVYQEKMNYANFSIRKKKDNG